MKVFMIRTKTAHHLCLPQDFSYPLTLADDWPQWQGPDRNAVSKETGLLQEWPKDGPPLAWKIKRLGGGDSAPSVAAGRSYGMGNRGDDEIVWALSEADGKELRATRLGPADRTGHASGKRRSRVHADRRWRPALCPGDGGELACLQVKDGKVIWRRAA